LDLQVLVAQLLFHEQLVVRLERLVQQVLLALQLEQLVQPEQVEQLVRLLVVAPLELVEHLCLVPQSSLAHLAYLF
jgi:hypothetical protein